MLHVAVAVIRDQAGRILLSRRPDDKHLGGLWEFPGGKLEPGESLADGLRREIDEELGIRVETHRPFIQVRHAYPDRQVLLDVHLVEQWHGEASGREGQEIAWVDPGSLSRYQLPPADKSIVTALKLPSRYLVTPSDIGSVELMQHLDLIAAKASRQEVILLQLSLFERNDEQVIEIAHQLLDRYAQLVLMVKEVEVACQLGCGVHLRAAELMTLDQRPLPPAQLVAASCHTPAELRQAVALNIDFVTLSPVQKTQSHSHATPLGWGKFGDMIDEVTIPVYALGGMSESDIERAWQAGAQGIAGISGVWPSAEDEILENTLGQLKVD
jgi:8-oxo-dGTP diphosphatase